MKTFREHLNEEVKIGALASGGIDIERDAIRDEINGILSAIAVRPCVTPYASLNKIRKALAYFSIFLPKKVYLEGRHGIEVWEVNQFGDKMGFTDQGEWIKNVPCKYYLFFHYHRIGSMYYLEAKIVDEKELESKVSTTEKMFAEEMDAAMRQDLAKAKAPKEDPHTALGDCDCSQGDSPSTKKAVNVSMKKIEEEMSHGARELATYADNHAQLHRSSHQPIVKNLQRKHAKGTYDHGKAEKLWGYHAKRASDAYHKEHGHKFSVGERKEAAKHMADSARNDHGFGTVKEGRMPASVIKHKQKLAGMTPEEKKKHFAGKSEEELKSMARRHGYGKDSDEYSKHVKEEKNDLRGACWKGYTAKGLKKKGNRMVPNCVPVEEKLTKDMPAGDVISDFVHSKDPKFEGKSKKMRQKMALGAYYGMHPEKSKKVDEEVYAMKKMKQKMATKIRHALGAERDTQTIMVKNKNDPSARPHRVRKDKYDPSKHQKV